MDTTSTIPQTVSSYYDRNLLKRALAKLQHTKWAQVRDIPQNEGKVAVFRKFNALAVATTALSEGITPDATSLSYSDISVTVAEYGAYVVITGFLALTTLDNRLMDVSAQLGEQAGKTLDTLARDVYAAGTNKIYSDASDPQVNAARTSVAAGDILSYKDLDRAILQLKNADVEKITEMVSADPAYATSPIRDCYVAVVSPEIGIRLNATAFPGFVEVEKYAGRTAIMDGEIGAYKDIRFVETTNAKVFTAGGYSSIDVYATLIFGKNAVGVTRISGAAMKNIVHPVGSGGVSDPLDQRSTSGWKATFAAVILQQLYMVRIESARV